MGSISCVVIKRNGTKTEFDSDKIVRVLDKIFSESDFEPSADDIDEILADVIGEIEARKHKEITTTQINDLVEQSLMKLSFFDEAKSFILYRQKNKIIESMSADKDAMSEYVFMSRYSRFIARRNRRETWHEAVDRVKDMHINKYPNISEEIAWAFEQVRDKRVLPSMRSMQFGGKPIEDKNSRLYNCTFSIADRIEFFRETMYLLLTGCGVGFSVEFPFVNKLPQLKKLDRKEVEHVTVEDSIEGWADSIHSLIDSYVKGYVVEFVYKKIRKEGAKIRSGGKAPGHVPLRRALEKCRLILDKVAERDGIMKPIEVYDIVMHIADAVISGGVRRSATICLFSAEDSEMLDAKTGNWFEETPWRGRSNNSVKLIRSETTKEQFMRIFNKQKEFGEPGFYFANDVKHGTNPCLTGDTLIATDKGDIRLDELIKNYSSYNVISYNEITREREIDTICNGGMTRVQANVIQLELEDGRLIKLTPDHKVFTKNRGWVEAAKLTHDDELDELTLKEFHNLIK